MATRTRSVNNEIGIRFPLSNGENVFGKKIEGAMKHRKPLQELSCKNSENLGPGKAAIVAKKPGGRRALNDLTNSTKIRDAPSRKNGGVKLASVVEKAEVDPGPAEEGFLHDHTKCMKADTERMDKDYFLEIVGLRKDCSTPVVPTRFHKEVDFGLLLPSPCTARLEFDHCETPGLTRSRRLESHELDFSTEWESLDFSGFKVKESPFE